MYTQDQIDQADKCISNDGGNAKLYYIDPNQFTDELAYFDKAVDHLFGCESAVMVEAKRLAKMVEHRVAVDTRHQDKKDYELAFYVMPWETN